MHNGVDIFLVEPGTVETMTCRVCGSQCDVRRDAYGPTTPRRANRPATIIIQNPVSSSL